MSNTARVVEYKMDERKSHRLAVAFSGSLNKSGTGGPPGQNNGHKGPVVQNGGEDRRDQESKDLSVTKEESGDVDWAAIVDSMVQGQQVHNPVDHHRPLGDRKRKRGIFTKDSSGRIVIEPWHILTLGSVALSAAFVINVVAPVVEKFLFDKMIF